MPNTINADNGVISGITGIRTTADNTGNLALQSNGVTLLTVTTANTLSVSNVATLSISGATSGAVSLAVPAVAGTNTVTIPAKTGNVMVDGPAFGVYSNANLSVLNLTNTKVLFQVEEFDTNNSFSSSTFTPTVAGYYQLNGHVAWSAATNSRNVIYLYKNGGVYKDGSDFSAADNYSLQISTMVYANGTTDYFEIYVIQVSGGTLTLASGQKNSWFNGSLVRGA
jgi:hypothetical protein